MDPIHKALHYRKTQARALVRVAGGIHWLHCLGNVRDTNAFIRYGNAHIAALIQNSRHRNGADGIRIGMEESAVDSF